MLYQTEFHFRLPKAIEAAAEIDAKPLYGWVLVNTGWSNYKIQSVLNGLSCCKQQLVSKETF
jgi:hypothetical protein